MFEVIARHLGPSLVAQSDKAVAKVKLFSENFVLGSDLGKKFSEYFVTLLWKSFGRPGFSNQSWIGRKSKN